MRNGLDANNIFQVAYRISALDYIFISKEYANDRIFSTIASNSPNFLSTIAKEMSEIYDITDTKSLREAIKAYDTSETYGVLLSLLFRAKNELGDDFNGLTFAKFSLAYANKNAINEALSHFKIKLDSEQFESYKEEFDWCAKYFFGQNENEINFIPRFIKFANDTKDIHKLCKHTTIAAFDYARVVQIATNGYTLGYINKEEFLEIFTLYTKMIKQIFSGFDEFIASFLLGRAFMNFFGSENFIDENVIDRTKVFYIALKSPFDMFKESGIWSENLEVQKAKISKILEGLMDFNEYKKEQSEMFMLKQELDDTLKTHGTNAQEFANLLDFYFESFYYTLKEYGVEFIYDDFVIENCIFTPLHELTDDYSFYGAVSDFLNKTKTKLAVGEYPIMAILRGNKTLITNRGFYIESGFMFMKKTAFTPHSNVQFRAVLDGTGDLKCFVSEKMHFLTDFNEYAKAVGKKISLTDDELNAKNFKDEINGITLTFSKMIEVLR